METNMKDVDWSALINAKYEGDDDNDSSDTNRVITTNNRRSDPEFFVLDWENE
jgi:hypothetical protein